MSKLLLPTLSLLLAIWLLGGSWWYATNYGGHNLTNSPMTSSISIEELPSNFSTKSNFFFKQSSDQLMVPKEALVGLKAIVSKLTEQPSKVLELTGLYQSTELNHTQMGDLGLARAMALKEELIYLGASSNTIAINSREEDHIPLADGNLYKSVLLNFSENNKTDTYKEDNVKVWKVPSINLNFDNREKKLKLTSALNSGFDKLKYVLNQEPNVMISITGHTDNIGSRKENLKLSKRRAVNVRDFMIENGFDRDRLQVHYKGPDEPIVSNDSKEGRKKNRRVEIRIK